MPIEMELFYTPQIGTYLSLKNHIWIVYGKAIYKES